MSGHCILCGVSPRSMSAHLNTIRHRRRTRCKATGRRVIRANTWQRALRLDPIDFATTEQLRAAEEWARS